MELEEIKKISAQAVLIKELIPKLKELHESLEENNTIYANNIDIVLKNLNERVKSITLQLTVHSSNARGGSNRRKSKRRKSRRYKNYIA